MLTKQKRFKVADFSELATINNDDKNYIILATRSGLYLQLSLRSLENLNPVILRKFLGQLTKIEQHLSQIIMSITSFIFLGPLYYPTRNLLQRLTGRIRLLQNKRSNTKITETEYSPSLV